LPISKIKNIGTQRAGLLKRLGVTNIKHLLLNFPTQFITESKNLRPGPALLTVRIVRKHKFGKLSAITAVFSQKSDLEDEKITKNFTNSKNSTQNFSEEIQITLKFFSPKAINFFSIGQKYKIFGELEQTGQNCEKSSKNGQNRGKNEVSNEVFHDYQANPKRDQNWMIKNPKIISDRAFANLGSAENGHLPIYQTSISNVILNKIVNETLTELPEGAPILGELSMKQAIWNLHNGANLADSMKILKFVEASLFVHLYEKKERHEILKLNLPSDFLNLFPFELNNEQKRAITAILADLEGNSPMKHFLYAEVGAGKTAIAFLCALAMAENGYNVAFLAPTVTLAQQHFNNFTKILTKFGISHILLSRTTKKSEKLAINAGKYKFVIATHALLFTKIPNLGLIVIDEIQKFGVLQKAQLLENAARKNVLMMSATPIPRSLKILLANFINFSIIENGVFEKQIKTTLLNMVNLPTLLERLAQNPDKTYWVMPSIEDTPEYIGAISRFNFLLQNLAKNEEFDEVESKAKKTVSEIFLLHGKMKDQEKIEIVENFKKSTAGILVATTVIEIGIDVPDANRIIIENASQFGLSQLHQLRGRVGRSGQRAFCVCLCEKNSKKLQYFKEFNDGFSIAQKDMELRGSGEWVGTLQHGMNHFSFLKLPEDAEILDFAKQERRVLDEFEFFVNSDIGY